MQDENTTEHAAEPDVFSELSEAISKLNLDLPEEDFLRETKQIKEISEQLQQNDSQTRKLITSSIEMVSSTLTIETMQLALNNAVGLVNASRGILYFWDTISSYFDRLQTSNTESDFTSQELMVVDEIANFVHEEDKVALNPKSGDIPAVDTLIDTFGLLGRSIIAAPISIKIDDKIDRIGAIYLDISGNEREFTENDKWVLKLFTSLTALSIRNIRITGSLRLAYRETIYALVKALEAKDPYTKGHSDRVAEYSERCGKRLGLKMESLGILFSAALLHDIGKIGIRENVLNKPSKLTSAEYDHIKKHPEISESILHGLDFLREENQILKQHHERYDGKGYPKGLKGDEISLAGAIIQVADAWDAMTSRRIYRKELDLELALQELRENAGTQFHPDIVEEFIEMIHEEGVVPVGEIFNSD